MELFERFQEWRHAAASTGQLLRVWVYGSFLSDKPGPGDIDVLALMGAGFSLALLPGAVRPFLDPETCETVFGIHLTVFVQGSTEVYLPDILQLLGTDETGRETAVEVTP